ncbi:P-loop containing nucleoside triphosphate hydrolase protein [Apiospora saccharicola]
MFLRILAPRVFCPPSSIVVVVVVFFSSFFSGSAAATGDEERNASRDEGGEEGSDEMQRLAAEFAARIPLDTLTPAQLQEFLLGRRFDRQRALDDIAELVLSSCTRTIGKAETGNDA